MSAMITELTTWPKAAEMALATSRMSTSGLARKRAISRRASKRRGGASSFGPHRASRAAASSEESPRALPATWARASSTPSAQNGGAVIYPSTP